MTFWRTRENQPALIKGVCGILVALLVLIGILFQASGNGVNFSNDKQLPKKTSSAGINSSITSTASVRKLEPLETGKYIEKLPDGIYGYVSGGRIESELKYAGAYSEFMNLSSHKSENYTFEVQKRNGSYFIIGFVGDETFSRIGEANEEKSINITLSPQSWDLAKHAVEIPFNAIESIETREIDTNQEQTIYVMDLSAKKITEAHDFH